MRKLIATITMVSVVLLTALSPAFAQSEASTLLESIESIEMHLYGEYLPGAIVDRLEQIERDVFGQVESGSVVDLSLIHIFTEAQMVLMFLSPT